MNDRDILYLRTYTNPEGKVKWIAEPRNGNLLSGTDSRAAEVRIYVSGVNNEKDILYLHEVHGV